MSMAYLVSWPYSDAAESKRKARDLFDKIDASISGPNPRVRFPYHEQCEVALIDGTDGWMIAIAGAPQDPALVGTMEKWLKACGGAEQPTAAESHDIDDEEIEDVVRRRGWGKLVDFTGALAA